MIIVPIILILINFQPSCPHWPKINTKKNRATQWRFQPHPGRTALSFKSRGWPCWPWSSILKGLKSFEKSVYIWWKRLLSLSCECILWTSINWNLSWVFPQLSYIEMKCIDLKWHFWITRDLDSTLEMHATFKVTSFSAEMHDRLLSKHRYQRLAWYIQRGTFQNEAIVIAICWKMVIFSAIPKISIEASPNILHTTQNHSQSPQLFPHTKPPRRNSPRQLRCGSNLDAIATTRATTLPATWRQLGGCTIWNGCFSIRSGDWRLEIEKWCRQV